MAEESVQPEVQDVNQVAPQTGEIDKLFNVVSSKGLYTKSKDEFIQKYSTPESIDKLFQVVSDKGLYTKSKGDFYSKYYPNLSSQPKTEQVGELTAYSDSRQKATPTEEIKRPTKLTDYTSAPLEMVSKAKATEVSRKPSTEPVKKIATEEKAAAEGTRTNLQLPTTLKGGQFGVVAEPQKEGELQQKLQQRAEETASAVDNTATERLKAKGIPINPTNFRKEQLSVQDQIDNGELSMVKKDGIPMYGRVPAVAESFAKGVIGSAMQFLNGLELGAAGNDNLKKADILENQSKSSQAVANSEIGLSDLLKMFYNPSQVPIDIAEKTIKSGNQNIPIGRDVTSDISGTLGGLSTLALTSSLGLGGIATQSVVSAVGDKAQQIYQTRKQEYLQQGLPEIQAKSQAAADANEFAPAAALPDAFLNAALMTQVPNALTPAAVGFKDAIVNTLKSATKMGLYGMGTEAAVQGIEAAQGQKPEDVLKKIIEKGGDFVLMDAAMHGLPLLAKGGIGMSKNLASSLKEYLTQEKIKPQVEQAISQMHDGAQVQQELNDYESTRNQIKGLVPEEHIAAYTNNLQEQQKIKNQIIEEQSKKASLPEALHSEIDKNIGSLNSQLEQLNKQLVEFKKSGNPIQHEFDEATGQPIIETETTPIVEETTTIEPTDNIKVGEMLDKTGTYKGVKGSFTQEGQTVIFKEEGKDRIHEIGNIDEVKNMPISDFDIKHEESIVSVDNDGNFNVRNEVFVNPFEQRGQNATDAILYDKDGNVVNVRMKTADGKRRTFKGNIAEDLAYQIHLKEINKNNETRAAFEQHINEDTEAQNEINNAGLPKTTEGGTIESTEQVPQQEVVQPKAKVVKVKVKPIEVVSEVTPKEEIEKGGGTKQEPMTVTGTPIIEHGEDTNSAKGLENGVEDTNLTEKGKKEAQKAGEYITKNEKIKNIVTSGVERAVQTTKEAIKTAKKLGRDIKTKIDKTFATADIGSYDGKPEGSFNEKEWTNGAYEGDAESFDKSFVPRMEKGFKKINAMDDSTLVVAHSKVLRAFKALEKFNDNGKWTPETTKEFLKLGEKEAVKPEATPKEEKAAADIVHDDLLTHLGITETPEGETKGEPLSAEDTLKNIENKGIKASDETSLQVIKEKNKNNPLKTKIIEQATKASKALKSIFPNMEIHLHENDAEHDYVNEQVGNPKGTVGSFSFIKNEDGTYTGRIDINLNKANGRTIAHEVTHAILEKTFGENKELFKSFREKISSILTDETNDRLSSFSDAEHYASTDTTHEEYLAELSAALSDTKAKINPSTLEKIAVAINQFVSKLTGGKFKPFEDVKNVKDVVDFFNKVSESIREGQDLSNISKDYEGKLYEQQNLNVKGKLEKELPPTGRKPKAKAAIKEGVDVEDHPIIDKNSMIGKRYSVTMSDHTKVGEYNNPKTGVKVSNLMGGVFYPYIKGIKDAGIGWASVTVKAAREMIQNASGQDATLVYRMSRATGSRGNHNFKEAAFAELIKPVTDKKITEKEFLKELNDKLNTVSGGKQLVAGKYFLDKHGNETNKKLTVGVFDEKGKRIEGKTENIPRKEITSIKQLKSALDKESFSKRGAFWSTLMKDSWSKKSTGNWYKFLDKNSVASLEDIANHLAEPEVDNAADHDIVAAVKIAEPEYITDKKGNKIIKIYTTRKDLVNEEKGVFFVDAPNHLSYPYVVKGEPIGVFNEFNHISDYFPSIKTNPEFDKLKNNPYKAVETKGKDLVRTLEPKDVNLSESERIPNEIKSKAQILKEEQDSKIKDFIEIQRQKGISDKDIQAGLEKASEKIGIDKAKIDELMSTPKVEEKGDLQSQYDSIKSEKAKKKFITKNFGEVSDEQLSDIVKNNTDLQTIKNKIDAIQKSGAGEVLQRKQEGNGSQGGKRGGMEQGEQGAEVTTEKEREEVGGGQKVGISHKSLTELADKLGLEQPQTGDVLTPEEYSERGKLLIKNGADPIKAAEEFKKDNKVNSDIISVARAHFNELIRDANDARIKFGIDSEEYKKSIKEANDWAKNVVKPMGTAFGEIGRSLQGQVDLDTGNFVSVSMAVQEKTGKDLSTEQTKEAERLTKNVSDLNNKIQDLEKKLTDTISKGEKAEPKAKEGIKEKSKEIANVIRKGKLSRPDIFSSASPASLVWDAAVEITAKTVEVSGDIAQAIADGLEHIKNSDWYKNSDSDKQKAAQKAFRDFVQNQDIKIKFAEKKDNKFTTEEAKSIWEYAKEEYLDKGSDYREMLNGVSKDLGLNRDQVRTAISQPKGAKEITDEMYRNINKRNNAINEAKQWVEEQGNSKIKNFRKSIPSAFFKLKTFGHGTVGGITHAGTNIFQPSKWKSYLPFFAKQFKYAFGDTAKYEMAMEDLKNDPQFTFWQRAGLAVDPKIKYDDYQGNYVDAEGKINGIKKLFNRLGVTGDRGFNALKVYRLDLAKGFYDRLSNEEKADPNTAKEIAKLVNHSTGTSELDLGRGTVSKIVSTAFFAPKLEASRWQGLIGDPVKAVKTFTNWKEASPAEKAGAKLVARNAGEKIATYVALLAANSALLSLMGSKQKINYTNPLSSDWLKFKTGGGKTLDVTGGTLASMKLLGTLLDNTVTGYTGNKKQLWKKPAEKDYQTILTQARYKLSPFASTIADIVETTDAMGRPLPYSHVKPKKGETQYTIGSYLVQQQTPIPISAGIREAIGSMKERGMTNVQIEDALMGALYFTVEGFTGAKLGNEPKKK